MGRALSDAVKAQKATKKAEVTMKRAIEAYQHNALKPDGIRLSGNAIAEKHGVNKDTLRRRATGGRSMAEFNASKQKLTVEEERVLVDHVLASADRGFPMSHPAIVDHANSILKSRGGGLISTESNWSDNFATRHWDELQTYWSKALDRQRAQGLNPEAVKDWFELVKEHIADPDILPENVYGMDESGFVTSDTGRHKVFGRRGAKMQHKQGGADRETTTAIITICADGTVLNPTLIFKGKNFQKKWGENNRAHASYVAYLV
jgi:hypothetical protein